MKTLLIMRHAEAEAGSDDFERKLSPDGKASALRIAARLSDHGLIPDQVLCSAAHRAVESCELVVDSLGVDVPEAVDRELYLAAPERLLAAIHGTADDAATVLMVAHNPGLQALVQQLVGGGGPDLLARLARPFPAAGLAVVKFDGELWTDVAAGTGDLLHFLDPDDPN